MAASFNEVDNNKEKTYGKSEYFTYSPLPRSVLASPVFLRVSTAKQKID